MADNIWYTWNGTSTAVTTTNAELIWNTWANGTAAATVTYHLPTREHPAPLTQEQIREQEERARAAREERQQAIHAAHGLLMEMLDEEQADQFNRNASFRVRGSHGGVYSLHAGGGVRKYNERDRVIEAWCVHPSGVPDCDTLLAQKLALENDENALRRIANVSRY